MYDLSLSRFYRSTTFKLATGITTIPEGLAMVATYEGGLMVVKPSTGASGEKFVGSSINQIWPEFTYPYSEQVVFTLDSTKKIATGTISRAPVGNAVVVYDPDTGHPFDGAKATVTVNGTTVTITYVNALTVSAITCLVQYAYSPTAQEIQSVQGNREPGLGLTATLGATGVIQAGNVYTSHYDTTADWSDGNSPVYLGNNGVFTTTAGGTLLNALILRLPYPGAISGSFLGLTFNY